MQKTLIARFFSQTIVSLVELDREGDATNGYLVPVSHHWSMHWYQ